MMLASIVLPRPTSSARMARPPMWRSTRWATLIWCGSALIAFASSVISRSKPGTRAIRSASRRSSCQARSVGGAWSRFANASRECLSTDQTSPAGGVGRGRTVGDSGIDTQRVARGPQYTSYPSRNAAGAERRSFAFPFLLRRALEPVQLGRVGDEDPAANGLVGRPLEQEVEQVGVVREGVLGRGRMRPVARPQHALRRRLYQRPS